jgi:hypothetical protein
MMYPKPLKIAEVPRVIMSGWIFSLMQRNPLNAPNPVPTNKIRGIAVPGGTIQSTIMMDKRTLVKTIWEPMERSIPPLIITNISPTALIPVNETWRTKVKIFLGVKKFSDMNENRIIKKISIINGTFFFVNDPIPLPSLDKNAD